MFVNKMSSLVLNVKEIGKTIKKVVCIRPIHVEVVFEGNVTYPTSNMMIKPCNKRLMT